MPSRGDKFTHKEEFCCTQGEMFMCKLFSLLIINALQKILRLSHDFGFFDHQVVFLKKCA